MGSRSRFPNTYHNLPQDKFGRQESPLEVLTKNVTKIYQLLLEAASRIDKLEDKVFPKLDAVVPKVKKVKTKKPKNV